MPWAQTCLKKVANSQSENKKKIENRTSKTFEDYCKYVRLEYCKINTEGYSKSE